MKMVSIICIIFYPISRYIAYPLREINDFSL